MTIDGNVVDVLSGESCIKVRDVTVTFDTWRRIGVVIPASAFTAMTYQLMADAIRQPGVHYAKYLYYALDCDALKGAVLLEARDGHPVGVMPQSKFTRLMKRSPKVKALSLLQMNGDVTEVLAPTHRFGAEVRAGYLK